MDNIRFYHCPPMPKEREHPASIGSTSTSRPVLEVSGPPESGSDHVQDDQTASQGRSPKPTASLVAAIELEEEIGVTIPTSGPEKNELASAVGELVHENSSLDPSCPRTSGVRSDPDVDESTPTTQLFLHQNAAADVHFEEQNDQRSDLERETHSVDPFSDIQVENGSADISVADAQMQLEHPGSRQIPSFNDEQSSAILGIHAQQVRRAVDQSDESRSIHKPIFHSTQATGPTSALALDPKLLDEGPDCTSHGAMGPRYQSPDSTSDGHGSAIANAPRISMDAQTQPNLTPSISYYGISRSQPADASSPTQIDLRDQDEDTFSELAAMPPQSFIPPKRSTGHDLTIYQLERTDSYLLTAVASSLQELRQLTASPGAWIAPQTVSSSDHFTVLGIKPLGDERWLLLAKASRPTHSASCPTDSGEEAADCHMETRRKREVVGNRSTLVNTHDRGRPVNSANGRLPRLKRGNWKESEDQKLSSMVELGVPWSSIVARFPRRSEAAVRSRWYCVLKPLGP